MKLKLTPSQQKRFLSKIMITDGCWEWIAGKDKDGYGVFTPCLGVKVPRTHRIAWATKNGQIPSNRIVCHKCDNPSCVRPSHLFIGTHKTNSDDKFSKGRQRFVIGSECSSAKLTEESVAAIRSRHAAGGVTQRRLAVEFGVGYKAISKILRGQRWVAVGGFAPAKEGAMLRTDKLNIKLAREIRSKHALKSMTQNALATEYAVSPMTISLLVRNKIWKEKV